MTKYRSIWLAMALVASFLSGSAVGQAKDWDSGSLREAGFADELGNRLDAAFADGTLDGLHGVVVIRHGRLRLERYYSGADERWGQDLGWSSTVPIPGTICGPSRRAWSVSFTE